MLKVQTLPFNLVLWSKTRDSHGDIRLRGTGLPTAFQPHPKYQSDSPGGRFLERKSFPLCLQNVQVKEDYIIILEEENKQTKMKLATVFSFLFFKATVFSYPNNFSRIPEEGARPAHTQ